MPTVTTTLRPGTIVAHPSTINPPIIVGDPGTAWVDDSTATSAVSHTDAGGLSTATGAAGVIDLTSIPSGATLVSAVLYTRIGVLKTGGNDWATTALTLWAGDLSGAEVTTDPNTLSGSASTYWTEIRVIPRDISYWWPALGDGIGIGYLAGGVGPSDPHTGQDSVIYDVWLEVTYTTRRKAPPLRHGQRDDDRAWPRPSSRQAGFRADGYL